MSNHNHKHDHCCKHRVIAYCEVCKVAYCKECGKEWRDYPSYWTQPWSYTTPMITPFYTTTCGDTFQINDHNH